MKKHELAQTPALGASFDAEATAERVAQDLSELYGKRLREVRLFGSWARGDATPESDLDLLVVLDPLDDPWAEHRRMDDVLWRHTLESGVVISAIPVSRAELDAAEWPALIRARAEGRPIG